MEIKTLSSAQVVELIVNHHYRNELPDQKILDECQKQPHQYRRDQILWEEVIFTHMTGAKLYEISLKLEETSKLQWFWHNYLMSLFKQTTLTHYVWMIQRYYNNDIIWDGLAQNQRAMHELKNNAHPKLFESDDARKWFIEKTFRCTYDEFLKIVPIE